MGVKLKRKGQSWRRKIPRPIQIRNGKKLALLSDCRDYALSLDEGESQRDSWQHAVKLMMAAAEGGDLQAVVDQFERILIHQNKLVLSD